ncbi:hypothetical protein GGS23DRAFT_572377 [Durotheca rogersii]|uniref:uncharacterized protein n=1 Tax=Durotheca rogersii TaxID=419775 RepID=UPI0022209BEC|nr:uncharacterized protein GGS23DRAFT_572377 [Durotheca rogersii]KAI5862438.1 hypothetical protein GGS23DRAFT_572377 [Durotheca rogersii]
MIFDLGDPLANVCLALACKRLLHVSSMLNLSIPSAIKHRDLSPPQDCIAMRSLVHLICPVNARGQPVRTLAVCCYCCRYRTTKKSHWKKIIKEKFPGNRLMLEVVAYRISSWAQRDSIQCPECSCLEELRSGTYSLRKKWSLTLRYASMVS